MYIFSVFFLYFGSRICGKNFSKNAAGENLTVDGENGKPLLLHDGHPYQRSVSEKAVKLMLTQNKEIEARYPPEARNF